MGVASAWETPGGNRGIARELMRRQRLVLSARFRSRLAWVWPAHGKPPVGNRGISGRVDAALAVGSVRSLPLAACMGVAGAWEAPGGNRGISGRVDAALAVGSVRSLPLAACMGVASAWEAPGGNRGIARELMRRQRLVLSARFRSRLAGVWPAHGKPPVATGG
jgi:hypothetical protein